MTTVTDIRSPPSINWCLGITHGTVSAKEPAATTSAPLAKAMIDTYAGNDVQLSDDWFNTISETAYTGVDATALEMLTYVFEWTYTYKD